MSTIALPEFERDIRGALARVIQGESLLLLDGDREIAQITPPQATQTSVHASESLVNFLLNSPLRDSDLVIERDHSHLRPKVEF